MGMEEIVHLKSKAYQPCQQYQYMQGRERVRLKADEYQKGRRNLKAAIRRSKQSRCMKLCSQVGEEPIGRLYKIVMKKVRISL